MIIYLFRNLKAGYSINKVFKPIVESSNISDEANKIYMPYFGASVSLIIKNIIFTIKNRNIKYIYHITGDIHYIALSLIGCKTVLTIHDLVFLRNAKNKIDYFFKWLLWLYLPVKLSNHTVCISEYTKQNVLKYVHSKNISVIYNPLDELQFTYLSKVFNKTKPVILHIGTNSNKNLLRVIEAVTTISCHLRIIGQLSDEIIIKLNQAGIDYSTSCDLSDLQIVEEYRKCDIISFPSLYEGFGMPIIEGQSIGRVVLTSNQAPLTEVGAGAVYYVDPYDVNDIRNGFLELISNDSLRDNLIRAGLENIKRFNLKSIVGKYIEIYNSI